MMGIASTMALLLAAVFILAAIGKLASPRATARDFDGLGIPLAGYAAWAVPIGELAIAFGLIVAPRIGSALAVVALLGFTAVLVRAIVTGRSVACGCLGGLWGGDSRASALGGAENPVSALTVARNITLMAMAIVVGATPSLVVPGVGSIVAATSLLGSVALGLQLWALRRSTGRIWSVELAGEIAAGLDSGGA